MALGDDAQHHSPSFLDALLCEERETFEEDFDENGYERETENNEPSVIKLQSLPLVLHNNDLFWEGKELVSLTAKEGEIHLCFHGVVANGALEGPRVEAVNWISKVCGHYGVVAESNRHGYHIPRVMGLG
ncbi:Cyclin-D3-2 [Glycine max]|nr:Cyclin-D3-2 [Glycine max]